MIIFALCHALAINEVKLLNTSIVQVLQYITSFLSQVIVIANCIPAAAQYVFGPRL